QATGSFRSKVIERDPSGQYVESRIAGLHVKLSEAVAAFPSSGGAGLTIFADTLVMDAPTINSRVAIVMAREIDLTAFQGSPMPLEAPFGDIRICEFLAGGTRGGPLRATSLAANQTFTIPAGQNPVQAAYVTIRPDGRAAVELQSGAAYLGDLIGR